MLSEWDTFCALSVEMEPLRSANDVGVLLQAMRQYPAGLPDRVILIAAELPAYSTQQIALLLARLDTVGIGLVQTSSRLADTGPQVHTFCRLPRRAWFAASLVSWSTGNHLGG